MNRGISLGVGAFPTEERANSLSDRHLFTGNDATPTRSGDIEEAAKFQLTAAC